MKKDNIESTLWATANKLRGSVEWGEYKHIILSLIFLKFANEKFTLQKEKLINDGKEKFIDTVEFYSQDNIFFIPPEGSWSDLIDSASSNDISQKIDTAIASLEKNNPTLSGALPTNYFTRLNINKTKIKQILDSINNLNLQEFEIDIIGRIYEYFLSKFSEKEGKEGQYYTPKHVVKLMNELIKPESGIIYDPCAGTGGMFVQTAEYLNKNKVDLKNVSFYGQESVSTTYKLARMNLSIRGIPHNFGNESSDTFKNDLHKDLKTDYIIANPPFNQKGWRAQNELVEDERWSGYEVPLPGNANYAWILHMISKMNKDSQASFLLANGALEDEDSFEIRKKIIQNGLIEAIITLPRNIFYGTDISVTLWILNNNKSEKMFSSGNENYHFRNRKGEIIFIDLRKVGKKVGKYIELTDEDIAKTVQTFYSWRTGSHVDIDEYSKSVTIEELYQNNFSLIPSRYINFKDRDLEIDFEKEMKELQSDISNNVSEQKKVIDELSEVFKSIGYEI